MLLAAAPASAKLELPLGHAGRWITDANGRVTILQGYHMVYKRPPYAPDAIGFGEDDARFLAAEGYETVRVGIIYKALEPEPGVYDDAYLDRIAKTVRTLGRYGIVSLLDFHQDLYNERFQGEGWPDWAVLDDGLPAEPKQGFPSNYLVMPALQRAYDNFFANAKGPGGVGILDRYVAAVRHVAQRFRRNDDVMGYDLINEPWPGAVWQDCINPDGCPAADAKLHAFSAQSIAAIRDVDRRHLIFYEPYVLFDFGGGTSIGPFDDDAQAERTGDALLLTEFGATQAPDILTAMVQRYERRMVGWQEWHYCGCKDPTTTGSGDKQAVVLDPARPPRGKNLATRTLRILTRPHPRAVAGTPLAYSFADASRTFTLRWTPARATGKGRFGPRAVTEIAMPRRQYGKGYVTRVRGARVVSKRGAAVLRLRANPGVDEARVVARPRG